MYVEIPVLLVKCSDIAAGGVSRRQTVSGVT